MLVGEVVFCLLLGCGWCMNASVEHMETQVLNQLLTATGVVVVQCSTQ